jgi:hypothetical protein
MGANSQAKELGSRILAVRAIRVAVVVATLSFIVG